MNAFNQIIFTLKAQPIFDDSNIIRLEPLKSKPFYDFKNNRKFKTNTKKKSKFI